MPVIQRAAAQRTRVHFQKARLILRPLGADRNLVTQERARTGGGRAAVFDSRRDQSRSSVARLASSNAWRTSAFRRR